MCAFQWKTGHITEMVRDTTKVLLRNTCQLQYIEGSSTVTSPSLCSISSIINQSFNFNQAGEKTHRHTAYITHTQRKKHK